MNNPLRIFFMLVALGLLIRVSVWEGWHRERVYHGMHRMGHGVPPKVDVLLANRLFQDLRDDRPDAAHALFANSHEASGAPLQQLQALLEADGQPTLTGWFHDRFLRTHHKTVLYYQFGHGDLTRQAQLKSTGTERTSHLASITIRQSDDIEAMMRTSSKLLSVIYFVIWSGAVVALLMAILGKRQRDL